MTGPRLAVVDAFTDRPFRGNPAGVVLLAAGRPAVADAWMASVARELNVAATAFVQERPEGGHDLRWFTPSAEITLCGHATHAATHVLGASTVFHTARGQLRAGHLGDRIELDLPARVPTPIARDTALARALGTTEVYAVARCEDDLVVELGAAEDVRGLRPDLRALGLVGLRGCCVTAPGDRPGIDIVSRFFVPTAVVPEDPVTGSAHCMLAPWWAPRLGRDELVGEQASSRGGIVGMRLDGPRVHLLGQAVTVWSGELAGATEVTG